MVHSGAKRTHFFSNNCNFLNFQYKKIMLTPKQPVINAVLITYIVYSITENYIGKTASFLPYTRPEPLLKVLHHIYQHFLWHSCNFFANGNFQIVNCTSFSNVDFWFEVTPEKETLTTTTHFKNIRSFCATPYMSYRFAGSLRTGSGWNAFPSWSWVSFQNKFEKLVHLVGFIITICHDARSPERNKKPYTYS